MSFSSKTVKLFLLICAFSSCVAEVELRTGKKVSTESVNKVTQALGQLKEDPTFENTLDNGYKIPPIILTEAIDLLGKTCKDGCSMSLEEFMSDMHTNYYIVQLYSQIIRENGSYTLQCDASKKEAVNNKIKYLYDQLCILGIIDPENGYINAEDGAALDASLKRGLDQHFSGTSSRGYAYVDPIKSTKKNSFEKLFKK